MSQNYHITVLTTGLNTTQVRAVVLRMGWTEVFCNDWIDDDRHFIKWQGNVILDDKTTTEVTHAALVDEFREHSSILWLVTRWEIPKPRCRGCGDVYCICEFLADNASWITPDEDKK